MSTILGLKSDSEYFVLLFFINYGLYRQDTMISLLCNFCKNDMEIILEGVVIGIVGWLCSGQGHFFIIIKLQNA